MGIEKGIGHRAKLAFSEISPRPEQRLTHIPYSQALSLGNTTELTGYPSNELHHGLQHTKSKQKLMAHVKGSQAEAGFKKGH